MRFSRERNRSRNMKEVRMSDGDYMALAIGTKEWKGREYWVVWNANQRGEWYEVASGKGSEDAYTPDLLRRAYQEAKHYL